MLTPPRTHPHRIAQERFQRALVPIVCAAVVASIALAAFLGN